MNNRSRLRRKISHILDDFTVLQGEVIVPHTHGLAYTHTFFSTFFSLFLFLKGDELDDERNRSDNARVIQVYWLLSLKLIVINRSQQERSESTC